MKTFIQKSLLTTAVLAVSCFCCNAANAEYLVGNVRDAAHSPAFSYVVEDRNGGGLATQYGNVAVKNSEGKVMQLFCSDIHTLGVGGNYNATSLSDSSFHSSVQIERLQSLFDHVYVSAFNEDYTAKNPLYASLFQAAVWEIMHETSNTLSATQGNIRVVDIFANTGEVESWGDPKYDWSQGQPYFQESKNILGEWFDSIMNDTWDEEKYAYINVDVTVWVDERGFHNNQTLIGVTQYPSGNNVVTPEPATMLIFGLGVGGAAFVRIVRRRK